MAKFNPEIDNRSPGNYIQYANQLPARRSLSTLFAGVGDTVNAYINERATKDQLNLSREADEGIDSIATDAMGGVAPSASLFEGTEPSTGITAREPSDSVPPQVEAGAREFAKLKAAFDQGNMSNVAFDTRVDALSRKLKSRYPEWADKVNDYIANAKGTSTTVQIMQSIKKEFEDSVAGKSAEEKERLATLKSTDEFLNNDEALSNYKLLTKKSFDPYTFDTRAWIMATAPIKAKAANIARASAELEYEEKLGKNVAGKAKAFAEQEAIEESNKLLTISMHSPKDTPQSGQEAAFAFDKLNTLAGTVMADQKISTEEMNQFNATFPKLQMAAEEAADRLVDKYSKYKLSSSDKDEIRKTFLRPLTVLRDAFVNNDIGYLSAKKRENEQMGLNRDNRVLQFQGNSYAIDQAAKEKWGPEFMQELNRKLESGADLDPEQAAVAYKIRQMYHSGMSTKDIVEIDKTGKSFGKIDKTLLKEFGNYLGTLADPRTDIKTATEAVKQVFADPELLKNYATANPKQVFDLMLSIYPRFKDTDAADDIYSWSLDQADVVLEPLAKDMYNAQVFTDSGDIVFNEKTNRFDVTLPAFTDRLKSGFDPVQGGRWKKASEAVGLMNSYLDKLEPMYTSRVGSDFKGFISEVLLNGDLVKMEKQGSFLTRMRDSFIKRYKAGVPIENGTGSKQTSPPKLPEPPAQPKGFQEGSIDSIDDFLQTVSNKPKEHVTGLNDEFAGSLAKMLQSAPPEIKQGLGIYSGARSTERQAQLWNAAVRKYGSPEAARKWVAPPGRSKHEHGLAADLSWNGESLAEAPGWVVKWFHENARQYGLGFPLGNENWHIEPIGARNKRIASK